MMKRKRSNQSKTKNKNHVDRASAVYSQISKPFFFSTLNRQTSKKVTGKIGNSSSPVIKIGDKYVGDGYPCFAIAEIGINHNGSLDIAKKLIDIASASGFDAVKFQKRTPELCVPKDQQNVMRETPWGLITYLEYRRKVEFGKKDYAEIDRYCRRKHIIWLASCWDIPSVDFINRFDPACFKISSACLTDDELLKYVNKKNAPIILSTGMSTMKQISQAVHILDEKKLLLAHCTSSYPSKTEELNLRMINTLKKKFKCVTGYSGHEIGLQVTNAAVALGAKFIERHITLDRAMWGSDQSASIEPAGLFRVVRDIRVIEEAMGDGIKKVYDSEVQIMKKLRLKQ